MASDWSVKVTPQGMMEIRWYSAIFTKKQTRHDVHILLRGVITKQGYPLTEPSNGNDGYAYYYQLIFYIVCSLNCVPDVKPIDIDCFYDDYCQSTCIFCIS